MTFLVENWYMIVAFVAVGAILGFNANQFLKLPKSAQIKIVCSILVSLVKYAEKQFGGGTGTQKLDFVYNIVVAIPIFTWIKEAYTMKEFDEFVKQALVDAGIWLADK